MLFVARPDLLTRVLGVVTRALSTAVKRRAGIRAGVAAATGVVTFIQRFGSAQNLNIHLHPLALDGACTFTAKRARFHRARAPISAQPGELSVAPPLDVRRRPHRADRRHHQGM